MVVPRSYPGRSLPNEHTPPHPEQQRHHHHSEQQRHHHDQRDDDGYGGSGHRHDDMRLRWEQRRPRYNDFRGDRSGALQWTAAVVFTVLAVAVLLAAVAVLVVVLLLQPRSPYLSIRQASLDALVYDQRGALDDVQLSVLVDARNGNARSAAAFSRLELRLAFAGVVLAKLRAAPFVLPPRGGLPLAYVSRAQGAALDATRSAAVEAALRDGVVPFGVDGEAKTAWKLAGVVGVHHWTRLSCELRFFWPNGTALHFSCSSKSKFWFF